MQLLVSVYIEKVVNVKRNIAQPMCNNKTLVVKLCWKRLCNTLNWIFLLNLIKKTH